MIKDVWVINIFKVSYKPTVVQLVLWTCSLVEQRLMSSLYDESTVRDADSVVQGDYGANIVG